jgi:hypothetical protein
MAEVLDLAELAVSDRAELEEVDFDRDTARVPSAGLANENQDPTVASLA